MKKLFLFYSLFLLLFSSAFAQTPPKVTKQPKTIKPPKVEYSDPPPAINDVVVYETAAPAAYFSKEKLDSLVAVYVPAIESVMQRKFGSKPVVKNVRKEIVASVLKEELKSQEKILLPNATDEQREQYRNNIATSMTIPMMGKYSWLKKELYLLPENLDFLLNFAKMKRYQAKGIMQAVLIHELVHVLQDETVGFTKIQEHQNSEEMMAYSAVLEGQANWATEKVGAVLGLDKGILDMTKLFSGGNFSSKDQLIELLQAKEIAETEGIYVRGRDFVQYHFEQGGIEKVWQVLLEPPVHYSMILQPETYSSTRNTSLNYDALLDLEEIAKTVHLEKGKLVLATGNSMMLETILNQMEREQKTLVIQKTKHFRIALYQEAATLSNPQKLLGITAMIFDDSSFAKQYIDWVLEMAKANIEKIATSPMITLDENVQADIDFPEGDYAKNLRFSFSMKMRTEIKNVVELSRFAKGNCMVEIQGMNYAYSEATAKALAKPILERCTKL